MMRGILKVIVISTLMLILMLGGTFFVLFTNTGVGLIQMFNNWKKGDSPIPSRNEIVMPPNATIEATTKTGTIIIKSGKGLKRYYTWDGATRSVVMWPREERWYGSFGIYYPGPGWHWIPNNGISRGVLEEGQQNFDTLEEAEAWLKRDCQCRVYNDSGLVVSFFKVPHRKQLNVAVWQIYIGGQTPSQYKESTFHEESAKIFGRTLEKEEIERIHGGRKSRIYHTGGKKTTRLEGSNNSAVITSWDNSSPAAK